MFKTSAIAAAGGFLARNPHELVNLFLLTLPRLLSAELCPLGARRGFLNAVTLQAALIQKLYFNGEGGQETIGLDDDRSMLTAAGLCNFYLMAV
ncbi:MAG: hypothetical protein ACFB0E_10345 [Leptolyngbyaceae cyanobacterium]